MSRVLMTTDYLHPGDEVDALLRKHGLEPVSYRPAVGPRDPEEALALFDGIAGAIVASEPVTAEMLDRATALQGHRAQRRGLRLDRRDRRRRSRDQGLQHPRSQPRRGRRTDHRLMLMAARRLTAVIDGVRRVGGHAKPATNCAVPPSGSSATGPAGAPSHDWAPRSA